MKRKMRKMMKIHMMTTTNHSFLVFNGVELKYVDEFGVKHNTIIE